MDSGSLANRARAAGAGRNPTGALARAGALAAVGLSAKVCFTASSRIRPEKAGHRREPTRSKPSAKRIRPAAGGTYRARDQAIGSSSASRTSCSS